MADPIYPAESANDAEWTAEHRKATRLPTLVMGGGMALFVIMLVILMIAFGIKFMQARPPVQPTAAVASAPADKDAQIAALQNQILTLQGQLLNHGGTPATAPGAAYAPDPAALAQLSARLDRIEAQQRALAHAAAVAEAAEALRRTAEQGAPFATELALVQPSLNNPHVLDPLRPYADKGIPSEVSLVTQFPRIAARANIAAKGASGDKSALSKLVHSLGSFVSVRRIDNDGGAGVEATIARAEKRINAGDLTGAVTYLDTLPAPAQAAIKPWLAQAHARVAIDTTTRQISEAALSTLGQAGNADAPSGGAL